MAEQADLFTPGVAETLCPSLDPAVGASGIDQVAALDEEGALAQLLARCGASEADPTYLAWHRDNCFKH